MRISKKIKGRNFKNISKQNTCLISENQHNVRRNFKAIADNIP